MSSVRLAALAARLGLSDDETLAIFGLEPLDAIGGRLDDRQEIALLDGMTADAAERAGERALAAWVRSSALSPRPIELLELRDWLAFEDALESWLRDSGLVA
ncbi:MAG TPA: hypothetical protein VL977_01030 [Solirubrobacteraceae bacterium]|nr:hypothetical protein [Solirubrobacteraceae bacterium]